MLKPAFYFWGVGQGGKGKACMLNPRHGTCKNLMHGANHKVAQDVDVCFLHLLAGQLCLNPALDLATTDICLDHARTAHGLANCRRTRQGC